MAQVLSGSNGGWLRTIALKPPEYRYSPDAQLCEHLLATTGQAAKDRMVAAMLLREICGALSGGGDTQRMADGGDRDAPAAERAQSFKSRMEVSRSLHLMAQPTIAAINGDVVGSERSLALAPSLVMRLDQRNLKRHFP